MTVYYTMYMYTLCTCYVHYDWLFSSVVNNDYSNDTFMYAYCTCNLLCKLCMYMYLYLAHLGDYIKLI